MQCFIATTSSGQDVYGFIQKTNIGDNLWRYDILSSLDQVQTIYQENTSDPQYKNKQVFRNFLITKGIISDTDKVDIRKIEMITKNWRNYHE